MNYERQLKLLNNANESGHLPHALLFWGRENIGKKDFAVSFVKNIIGQNIQENVHPDFILLDSKEEIKIADIRNLIQKLSFKPYSAPCKFALVNNAHLMGRESQNCFLKFLEEPSDKTHLILITAYPYLLLPTIISRVQKIRFYSKNNIKENEEISSDLIKLKKSDLAERFNFAKNLAEKDFIDLLNEWTKYLRKEMISSIDSPESKKISFVIKEIEKTKFLLSTTNVNVRLALEILLMKI
jgi:DNA polymerase III delta prime subunit